jgi:hypothetical protein
MPRARAHSPKPLQVGCPRFTTAVDRGPKVYPYRWKDPSAAELAESVGAQLADGADVAGLSLSPVGLLYNIDFNCRARSPRSATSMSCRPSHAAS